PELQQRLTTAPGMQGASNLQVLVSGDIAILRGRVSSDYARELAAAMIRLEPGIYRVENQLEIVPAKP
ncbi:MAG TPA: BON domain-containing protein, partial [Gemmatales bacterium]|nr:BON domain-containing protein [Gemmatales bacterium]